MAKLVKREKAVCGATSGLRLLTSLICHTEHYNAPACRVVPFRGSHLTDIV